MDLVQAGLDRLGEGIAVFDANFQTALFNRPFVELLDLPLGLIGVGAPLDELTLFLARRGEFGPGDAADISRRQLDFLKGSDGFCYERVRPNGTILEVCGYPLAEGGLAVSVFDVSERKRAEQALRDIQEDLEARIEQRTAELTAEIAERRRAEEALRANRHMLRAVIDAVPAMINAKDRDSRYVLMNRYQAVLYGVTPEAAIGMKAADFLGREYGEWTEAVDREVFATGEAHRNYEESYLDAAGRQRVWLTTKVPLSDGTLCPANVVTVALDITKRKRADKALLRAKEEAAAANEAKSEFLARMSHDMRTPLNAILGFAEIIADETFGPDATLRYREYARHIHDSGSLLLNLINDILDLSKIEAGKIDLADEAVDVGTVIDSSIKPAGVQANAAGLRLRAVPAPDLPHLRCDRRALRQILDNLLSNALKFTPEGGEVVISAGIEESGAMALCVADTGIGIAPEDIDRALEPFEQIDSAIARPHAGTGLGLHLCRHFVELHDGSLTIESEIGVGTAVTVRFPGSRVIRTPA